MSQTAETSAIKSRWTYIVLDSGGNLSSRLGRDRTFRVSSLAKLREALRHANEESVWIVTPGWTNRLLKAAVVHFLTQPKETAAFGNLLLLEPPRIQVIPCLRSYFRRVVGEVPSYKILPLEQLAEVLGGNNRRDVFIGGIVDVSSGTLTLDRGDFRRITVPLSIFRAVGPVKPDFRRFELADYGYTIRLGDYEAAAHPVLFEVDADYRRRVNQQRIAEERGFGPSLRRLRQLHGFSRGDFPGIASKTIARIERGETERPHGETLDKIAKAFNVSTEEIESY